jgi:hypothetical protein
MTRQSNNPKGRTRSPRGVRRHPVHVNLEELGFLIRALEHFKAPQVIQGLWGARGSEFLVRDLAFDTLLVRLKDARDRRTIK